MPKDLARLGRFLYRRVNRPSASASGEP
jgi:hypothetical protein